MGHLRTPRTWRSLQARGKLGAILGYVFSFACQCEFKEQGSDNKRTEHPADEFLEKVDREW